MNRHSRALLTICLVAAVLLPYWWLTRDTAPPGTTASATPVPTRGGTIVTSMRSEPRSFNRLVQPEVATDVFTHLTQGKLVRVNRVTMELEPWLAERWSVSPDGREFTLTLRAGVAWSDATPFTAADVLFSFSALYDPRVASPLATAVSVNGQPLSVRAPDAHTVVVTYPATFGPGLRLLDSLPILPRHKLERALLDGTFSKAWAPDTPPAEIVGLGPFVLAQYQPAQRLIFERNPQYWRRDDRGNQLPYADRLTIELLPDQDAELLRLQSGQTDATLQPLRAGDIETLRPLASQGKVQIVELGVSPDADSLVFNLRPSRWAADPRASWWMRREFRQALSHAVDREAFANAVFLGTAVPVHGPVTPGNVRWFWPSLPRYDFSREKARALFRTVGLENRDADEWLEDERGTEARIALLTFRGNRVLERSATVLRDDLRQVGIALEVVALEPNAVRQSVVKGDFEAALITFNLSDPDPALSKDLWLSSGSFHLWNPGQKTPETDWERQIDELMARQSGTLDEPERKRLFQDIQRIFAENLPMLHFAAPRIYVGTSARLINVQASQLRPHLLWAADTLAVADAASSQTTR